MMRTPLLALSGAILGAVVGAQTPSFEVASVKPNDAGFSAPMRVSMPPGERITASNVPARTLIQLAYGVNADRIEGGPRWLNENRFDVVAKTEKPEPPERLRLMLQTLLAERFQLQTHTEIRTVQAFGLVFAREDHALGPGLRHASRDCAALRADATAGVDPCGAGTLASALVTGRISARGMRLRDILPLLGADAGRPVVDRTALEGPLDIDVVWTPRVVLQSGFDQPRIPGIDPNGPALATALREQLGLKVEPSQSDEVFVIVDRIELPTPD